MKKLFPVLSVFCAIMVLCVNCPIDQPENYDIGDIGPSGVGIVFYITDGGLHGLEAAPSDQSTSHVWSNIENIEIGTTGTAIGTGLANSNAIISQVGHTESAAKLCRDYNGGGLTDWFLPSRDELSELRTQRAAVGGLSVDYYWTSSEGNSLYAWAQFFGDGSWYNDDKSDYVQVRAIRAF